MSVTNPERVVTKQDLADFYEDIFPFLGGRVSAGFTPIGTIIPMIAEVAPANYLICNGATYNKSDYPELASHLLSMTNHSMYEVSGDATKFKVPDLRGEFLRGTGTNSHANQGNGVGVGVHQDATAIPSIATWTAQVGILAPYNENNIDVNADSSYGSSATNKYWKQMTIAQTAASSGQDLHSVRPTTTSVLFCIATKNIYIDPKNDYSTEEKVVGTWVNGATLYQKTIVDTFPSTSNEIKTVAFTTDLGETISINATVKYTVTNGTYFQDLIAISQDMNTYARAWTEIKASDGSCNVLIQTNNSVFLNCPVYVTVQYTKA